MEGLWNQMVEAHNEVMEALPFDPTQMMSSLTEGPGVLSGLQEFVDAVEWSKDPYFFGGIAAFHVLLWIFCIFYGSRTPNRLIATFIFIFAISFSADYINSWASANYEVFFPGSKVNYFDEGGVFFSALITGPLVVVAFAMQIRMLVMLANMMAVVKRGQQRERLREESSTSTNKEGKKNQ